MPSDSFTKELLGRKAKLVADRDLIDMQLKAIDLLLGGMPPQILGLEDRGAEEAVAAPGFRAAVMAAVSKNPQGLTPESATKVIEAAGFVFGGQTKLRTRVGNELWRLKKKGRVGYKGGRYLPLHVVPGTGASGGTG